MEATKFILVIFTSLALNLTGTAAFAQAILTVGELLDKGGKKLTKEEVSTLLTGATSSGIQRERPQTKFQITFKPDGSVSGSAINWETQRNYVSVTGKWSINEKGQSCNDLRNSSGNKPTGSGNCSYWFSLGNSHYQAPTDERDERANERTVTR